MRLCCYTFVPIIKNYVLFEYPFHSNIWLVSFIWMSTVGIHCQVTVLCSSPSCLLAPDLCGCDGNTTTSWTCRFSLSTVPWFLAHSRWPTRHTRKSNNSCLKTLAYNVNFGVKPVSVSPRNTLIPCLSSSAMKTSVSMDSSDQKKTRMKLKKFLIRRPTYQAVRDKGYIKGIKTEYRTGTRYILDHLPLFECYSRQLETFCVFVITDQVFGCSLTSLCQRENTSVPNFVKMCIDHVENTGTSARAIVSSALVSRSVLEREMTLCWIILFDASQLMTQETSWWINQSINQPVTPLTDQIHFYLYSTISQPKLSHDTFQFEQI